MIARFLRIGLAIAIVGGVTLRPSLGEEAVRTPPFKPYVDMKTFMEQVLTPAANIVWRVNAVVIDGNGERNLSPKSDADWEEIVSGAATLAEAANALMIPQRAPDSQWNAYASKLGEAAAAAYAAAEAHDLKTISAISDRLDGICAACHRHYGIE
jgi:hypothetical protein